MDVVKQATGKCNPGQIPVIALDQPLFALAKYVQWTWPDSYGEASYITMFGGLHIEMGLWRMIGHLLQESGWTAVLSEAGIASTGTADSFLVSSHLTRTRHAHQISVLSLAKLQKDAHVSGMGSSEKPFQEWINYMCDISPTFKFWDMIIQLQTLILIFVRSHRERNFQLYVDVLEELVPWFFVTDQQNYARWIPVHIRDMRSLPENIKEQLHQFWVFSKSGKRFSAMPLDQAHEQNNAKVKDTGGAVGLTENPAALKRWAVAGPEQARILEEFESSYLTKTCGDYHNHEEGQSTQETFKSQVNKLTKIILSKGNPFLETSPELMTLDSHIVLEKPIVQTLYSMECVGKEQHASYVKEVLVDRTASIHQTIKRNKLILFKKSQSKRKVRTKQQMEEIKND